MAQFLRQSTASQEVVLGYFVDSTDGNTEETGLTIANTDIKLHKHGATTLANKNSGGGTHISNGVYYAVLDATDTDTLGNLVVHCHPTGALAFRSVFVVLPAKIFDSLILGTDNLETDNVQWLGGTIPAVNVTGTPKVDVVDWLGSGPTAPSVSGVPKIDISHVNGAAFNASAAQFGANLVSAAANTLTASALATDAVNEIVAAVLAGVVESGFTVQDVLKLTGAAAAGKSSGLDTGSPIYRNLGDTLNRIAATASAGNRTAVTHNLG